LRDGPGPRFKIIGKLREGDLLLAGTEQCSRSL
jgi:hypothetical protein